MKPFEQVVTEHGATVLRVCRAVLGPVDADDAWSETFLAALRAYPQLAPEANVRAWLVTIAHRKAIDMTRRRRRQPVPMADLPERSRPARTIPIPIWPPRCGRCPNGSGWRWPTTTSADSRTPRRPS